MSVVDLPAPPPAPGPAPQEAAWRFAEGEAVAVMGTVNVAVARLVAAVRGLLDTDGWEGVGIRSPEHWLCWKANLSRARAEGLVTIARRARELPECWAAFAAGRLGEDAMVRIARRVPAARDAEVAALAPTLLVAQLDRLLRALPEQPDGTDRPPAPEPERMLRLRDGRDGWLRGEFCLPADEGALVRLGLTAARDAEFRDRNDLPDPDTDTDADPVEAAGARSVSWADGLVRMASEAADALDPTYRRTGQRGERTTVVLHIDVDPDGTLGPAQLDMGPVVPDPVARYLACDATSPGHGLPARPAHRHPPHPTHPQPGHAPLPGPPRPRLHPPPLHPEAVAPRPPHRLLGTRRPDRARQSRALVPDTPPGPAPRRVLHRRQPREPAPSASSTASANPSNPHLGPPPTHRPAPHHPTIAHRATPARRTPHPSPNGSPPTPSPGTDALTPGDDRPAR